MESDERRLRKRRFSLLTQRGYVEIRFVGAPVEIGRVMEGARTTRYLGTAFEQTAQLARRGTDRTGQADGGEEGGTRCADVGIGLFERVFGGADVGTVQQHSNSRPAGDRVILNCLLKGSAAGGSSGRGWLIGVAKALRASSAVLTAFA